MTTALITGITGQDGSYLAEFLLHKGYEVHGIIRRASTFNTGRIDHIYQDPHQPQTRLFLHYADLADAGQLTQLVYNLQPEEIYRLGPPQGVPVRGRPSRGLPLFLLGRYEDPQIINIGTGEDLTIC